MNTKNILVAALLVSAAGLSAVSVAASADNVPGKTRAEVKAELIQARANGWHSKRDDQYLTEAPQAGTRTRAEVKAELLQARAQDAASNRHISPEE
jgi:hypothetical protein